MAHRPAKNETILNPGHLAIITNWCGDTVAAARAAGYRSPRALVKRLNKNPVFLELLKQKQESMAKESGKLLGRRLTMTRAEVINRLWELAQMPPRETNHNISGQLKAAEALAAVFDIKIIRPADARKQVEGKTSEEIDFFVANGYWPKPANENHADKPPIPVET